MLPTSDSSSEPSNEVSSKPEETTVTESRAVANQPQLPNTGETNSQLFFSLVAILTGFFGISLFKKTQDNE